MGVALASESAVITEIGIQFDCIITDYLAKDKPTELPITLFHPNGSRFVNQTTTVRRGSSVFFSGALTFIEDKLYLELHNFNFLRGQQSPASPTSIKQMPWSKISSSTKITISSAAQAIHKKSQQTPIQSKNTTTRSLHKIQQSSPPPPPTSETNPQDINDELPASPSSTSITPEIIQHTSQQPTPKSTRRKTRLAARTNKKPKLANLASNALASENDEPNNDTD